VQFENFTVKGVLYQPDSGAPQVAVLLIHRVNNYLGHIAAGELARRGFLVLAMNSRFDNNEASVIWEAIALDVKEGVNPANGFNPNGTSSYTPDFVQRYTAAQSVRMNRLIELIASPSTPTARPRIHASC